MNSISQTKISKKRIFSETQAIVKIIEKKDKDKCFIKNWRPISLLNVGYKIFLEVFFAFFFLKKYFKNNFNLY